MQNNWHEVQVQMYAYVNKGILVMEPWFHDEAWNNIKWQRSPKWSFWEKHIWDEILRSADAVSITSS